MLVGRSLINDGALAVLLFVVASLAILIAMAGAPIPLSLDGPSHIYSAVVMRHLFAGDALYRKYFHFGSPLIPNWLASVLAAVIALPGGSRWSIAVMNALVILLTTVALYFVARRSGGALQRPEHRFYVLTILMPLAVNAYLMRGFWGFLISADLCFIAVGLLQDDRFVWRRIVAPALVLLGFWAHPVPVMLTALIPAAGYARAMFEAWGSGRAAGRNLTADFALSILPWCVAGLFIISFAFVLAGHGEKDPLNLKSRIAYRLAGLSQPDALSGVSPTAMAGGLFIAYVTLLWVGALAPFGGGYRFRWQLIVLVGLLLVLYFIIPDNIGNGNDLALRVLWMVIVTTGVIAVSGGFASNIWYLRSCALCAATIIIVFAVEYLFVSRRMEPAVRDLTVALATLPKQSKTLLLGYKLTPICRRWPILEKTMPERHWAMIEAIPRELIVLNDYEPETEHFPVEYRDQRFSSIVNEFNSTVVNEAAWARALDSAEEETFVVSWGVPNGRTEGCEAWVEPPLQQDLRRHYELQYQNANFSRVQVWERRKDLPSADLAQKLNRPLGPPGRVSLSTAGDLTRRER